MIIELAEIRVQPEQHEAFGKVLSEAIETILSHSRGYMGHEVLSCHETLGRWVLLVRWETFEAHTIGFRQSEAFVQWRALISPFFVQPPHVEHFTIEHQTPITKTVG